MKLRGEYTGPISTHVFSNRLFPLFKRSKFEKFDGVGKKRFWKEELPGKTIFFG